MERPLRVSHIVATQMKFPRIFVNGKIGYTYAKVVAIYENLIHLCRIVSIPRFKTLCKHFANFLSKTSRSCHFVRPHLGDRILHMRPMPFSTCVVVSPAPWNASASLANGRLSHPHSLMRR